ncbi:hypothetical protein GNY06_03010 [Elizabethkingia argentiflava]|uniref:Aspartyl protease n=1 Tax=Elizabethkingia argenteiflava TaxID=2681556 RepID=A0A845PQE5_9FLAO|nr:hypothetical protein [Elizabethkingia argenteiflava]NAW50402.1 hypothetical protein [Elizabethkingia argenteiflava]
MVISFNKLDLSDKYNYINIEINDDGMSTDIFTNVILNNNIKAKVLLDSGAGNNSFWINSKYIKRLGLDKERMDVKVKKSEFNNNIQSRFHIGNIESIKTQNNLSKKENPRVLFVDELIYDGKTSIEWLGKIISIDLINKKIYILQ